MSLELVDESDHGRPVDGEDVGQGLLGDGAELAEHGKHAVVAPVDAERGESHRAEPRHACGRADEHETEASRKSGWHERLLPGLWRDGHAP